MDELLDTLIADTGGTFAGTVKFILKPVIILFICKLIITAIMKVLDKVFAKSKMEKSVQTFSRSAIRVMLWCVSAIMIADSLGVNTSSLVAVLSVVSLALSLAFQEILSNVFSGFVVIVSKPFEIGDEVDIGGTEGYVTEINIMRTKILTYDNSVQLIPNSDVASARITNYSTEKQRRIELKINVSYSADTQEVKKAIMRVIKADVRIRNEEKKKPFVRLSSFRDSDVEYTLRAWTTNKDYWDVYYDLLENIREEFKKSGIEFSYPHVTVNREEK